MEPKWLEEIIRQHQSPPNPDRIQDIWGRRAPYSGEWPAREDGFNKSESSEEDIRLESQEGEHGTNARK